MLNVPHPPPPPPSPTRPNNPKNSELQCDTLTGQFKIQKMDFPRFAGNDLVSWPLRAEQFFVCRHVPPDHHVAHGRSFRGNGVRGIYVAQHLKPMWDRFMQVITARFGLSVYKKE